MANLKSRHQGSRCNRNSLPSLQPNLNISSIVRTYEQWQVQLNSTTIRNYSTIKVFSHIQYLYKLSKYSLKYVYIETISSNLKMKVGHRIKNQPPKVPGALILFSYMDILGTNSHFWVIYEIVEYHSFCKLQLILHLNWNESWLRNPTFSCYRPIKSVL